MPEQFDPRRHRVFAVDVTRIYRTYVVAKDAERAVRLAAEREGDDLDDEHTSADGDYVASELTSPLGEIDRTLPWGPAAWGRRELTVNQALELVRRPPPAPTGPATDELRYLATWDWVRLAASTDRFRPALCAVQVAGGRGVATDGRRL